MNTIEIEADIVDQRLDVRSHLLPTGAHRARVIVMVEEDSPAPGGVDILALARTARASFPMQPDDALSRDLAELRDEWNRMP